MHDRTLYSFEDYCGIEEKYDYWGTHYRYYSKYNGARGAWHYDKDKAREDGEVHIKIIRNLERTNR